MQIKNLRYNTIAHAFEASVDVVQNERVLARQCWVYGPRDLDPHVIQAALRTHAQRGQGSTEH